MTSSIASAAYLDSLSVGALDAIATGIDVVGGLATALGAAGAARGQILSGQLNAARAANNGIRDQIDILNEEARLIGEEDSALRRRRAIEIDALDLKGALIALQGLNLARSASSGITSRGSVAIVNQSIAYEAVLDASLLGGEARGERLRASTIAQVRNAQGVVKAVARLRATGDGLLSTALAQSSAARLYGQGAAAGAKALGALAGYQARRREREKEEERESEEDRERVPLPTLERRSGL